MSERPRAGALERNPDLVVASVYEREVRAGLDSVWENVFDWEHLPWLQSQAFSSIALRASGSWGWRAEVVFPGDARAEIELVVDREANRYVARTLEGSGAPGEIWTSLDPVDPSRTRIRVEFCVTTRSFTSQDSEYALAALDNDDMKDEPPPVINRYEPEPAADVAETAPL